MAQNSTLIVRAALERRKSIYRDIEIEASDSLYSFARAIIMAFGFDFDHAFGFYTGLTPAKMMREYPRYELFADMGETGPNVGSVKKTKVAQAFPIIGHTPGVSVRLWGRMAFSREPQSDGCKSREGSLSAHCRNAWRRSAAIS
jgi:hypothetical protein